MTGSSVNPETNDKIMFQTIAEKMTGQMDIVAKVCTCDGSLRTIYSSVLIRCEIFISGT